MPVITKRARNKITNSPLYATVLADYNEIFHRDGKVNNAKFFEEYVRPRIPVTRSVWYKHIKKIETAAGVLSERLPVATVPPEKGLVMENRTVVALADSAVATRRAIQTMLNIGADAAQEILDNPAMLSAEKRMEFLLKAMRAQDSRIFAVAAVKKDRREEKAFQTSFNDAVYQDEIFDEGGPTVIEGQYESS